jgi:Tfp pilus assembly protein PilX
MIAVLALWAVACLTLPLAAILLMATLEPHIAQNLLDGTQAFAVAESGLEVGLWRLRAGARPEGRVGVGEGQAEVHATVIDGDHVALRSIGRVRQARRVVANLVQRDVAGDGQWHFAAAFREED